MGESCIMHMQSFNEPQQEENNGELHELGESVSFGRFMSEPLAWEKWSSFNNNRYLEEVEKYSKPGSVAQKKAYFEAHYKKKLAEKAAAAALEFENAEEGEGVVHTIEEIAVTMDVVAPEEEVVAVNIPVSPEKLPLQENSSVNRDSVVPKINVKPKTPSKGSVRASKLPFPPARPRTPGSARKENNPTLSTSKKISNDLADKRKSTPKSLHMSLNAPLLRDGEINKATVTRVQKSRDPIVAAPLAKGATAGGPMAKVAKLPPVIPHPYSRRTKAPRDHTNIPVNQTARGSRKMDVKSKSVSVIPSETSTTAWASSVSSSFSLRSEERAAKRREYFQKLQEEQNAREAQKLQLQAKSEEKAEVELKRLRQNLGFKAKPMPDFYREPQTQKTPVKKKIPLTVPRSPKLGRKSNSSACHEPNPLPPKTPSAKDDISNEATNRTSRTRTPTPSHSAMSTPRRNAAHENDSPNIQR